jgi:hypothetical protein
MTALYWFALVIGAGLLGLSLFGDLLGHGHGFGDGHGELPQDVDHAHADADGFRILTLRNATYFLFAFGAAGLLAGWATEGDQPVLAAVLAMVLGVVAAGISAVTFGWVRRTESGYLADDAGWVGRIGDVLIPLSADGTGKILVGRAGRDHELLARPYERDAETPEQWRSVVILELQNGVALVSPYSNALDSSEPLRIPSTES